MFVRNHTTGTSASGTSVTATLAADVAAGNLLAVWAAMDNTGTTTPTVSSIDTPGGESATWARVASHDASSATSAAAVRGELWIIRTTVTWTSGTVITATLSASPPKSHLLCQEHDGTLATLRGTSGTGTSTAGTPSAATSGTALQSGDLVLGAATGETSATPSGDTDTTNGSWSTALTGNTGGGASATQVSSILQYKYVTAAGVQTYNPVSVGTVDSGAAVASLQFNPNKTLTDSAAATDSLDTGNPVPVLTLDASAIGGLADADPVSSWTDDSGTGNTVTQATAGSQPSYQTGELNGLPVVRFDGGDSLAKTTPVGTNVQNFTIFAVVRPTTLVGVERVICGIGDSVGGRVYRFKPTGEQNLIKSDVVDLATGTTQHATGTAVVVAVTYASSGAINFYKTGNVADGSATPAAASFADGTPVLRVGSHIAGGQEFYIGDIGEIRYFPRVLSAGERAAQFTELEAKWISAGATPKTLADSGAAADQLQVAADVPLPEAAAAADTLSPAAQVPLLDQGVAADTVAVTVPKTVTDAGTAADSIRVTAQALLADSVAAADTVLVAAQVPLGDNGAGADSVQVTAQVPLVGVGTAADTLTVGQFEPKTLADSGQAADTVRAAAQVPLVGVGQAADSLAVDQGATPKSLGDAGLAADALAVQQPTWLTDTFQQFGTAESWADATTHGQWFVQFGGVAAGNGAGTEPDGSTVLYEKPDVATNPTPGAETHAGLVTSTAQFGANLDFAVDVKTVAQLRQNLTPNPWEVAWLVWAYTDNNHFYYFALKTNGIELGKRHPAYAGGQRFLWTAATPTLTLNTWNRIRVVQDANVLSVFVDGTELTLGTGGPNGKSFVDVGGAQADAPYLTGTVGLYNEDAWVRFDNVQANAAVPADSGQVANLVQVAALVSLAEQGQAADSVTVDQGAAGAALEIGAIRWVTVSTTPKTLTDGGAAGDTVQAQAAAALTDQAAAADSIRVIAQAPLADSGAAADTVTVAAQVALGDQATAADSMSLQQGIPKTLADAGAAAEQFTVAAQAALAEQGTPTDQLQVAAEATLAQQGGAADSLTVGQFEPKTLADSGTAGDQLQAAAAVLLSDQGAAGDTLPVSAAVLLTGAAAAADQLVVSQGIPKTLADSGTSAEQLTVTVQASLPDSGQVADTVTADQTRTLADSGAGTDTLAVGQFVAKPLNDSGAAADQVLAAAQAPLGDGGSAAEQLLPVVLAPLADSGAAADVFVVQQLGDTKTLTDSAAAADSLAVTQARLLADSGAGSDQLVVVQGHVLADTATGTDAIRPSALVIVADGATANDLVALAALTALGDHGTGADALVVLTVARWIRTQSTEHPTTTVSREPATATASREPALATTSREQGGP